MVAAESATWKGLKEIDPLKVAIYVRWSTDDQGDGTTLETQLAGCRHYILSQGWSYSDELTFIDDGYSGGSLDRPAMTKLREAVQEGLVDCVVVFKLDRLSRSVIDTVNLVLDEWGDAAHLKSAREPIDTTTPMGKQFFYILTSFAEWERSVIKERTFGGKVQRAKEGKNPGFLAPYGYKRGAEAGMFEIIPEEAEIVKRIFREYVNGRGSVGITEDLNRDGIKFRKNKPWNASTVQHILKNEFYMGVLSFGKLSYNTSRKKKGGNFWIKNENPMTVKSNFIEPIIDPETFKRVQEIRRERRHIPARSVSSPFLLSGLLFCTCGHAMVGKRAREGENYAYYACRGNKAKGKSFCKAGVIRQNELDKIIINQVKKDFLTDAGRLEIERNLIEQSAIKIRELEIAINAQTKELSSVDAQRAKLDADYLTGVFDAATYVRLMKSLEEKSVQLNARLKELQTELNERKSQNLDERSLEEFTNMLKVWETLNVVEQRNLLRAWIKQVVAFRHAGQKEEIFVQLDYKELAN